MLNPRLLLWLPCAALVTSCAHTAPSAGADAQAAGDEASNSTAEQDQQAWCAHSGRAGASMMTLDAWGARKDAEDAARPAGTPAPFIRGSLSKAVIRERIAAVTLKMRACFECAVGRTPTQQENVAVRKAIKFIIAPEGHIAAAAPEGADRDPEFTLCMLGVLQGVRFPPPDGGGILVVTYPWCSRSALLQLRMAP